MKRKEQLEKDIALLEKQVEDRNYSTHRPNNSMIYWGLRVNLDKKREELRLLEIL